MNTEGAAAAAVALKAYSLEAESAEFGLEPLAIQRLVEPVDLTEAPEDAVCSLVVDLMHFCQREKIDWMHDVVLPAGKRFWSESIQ